MHKKKQTQTGRMDLDDSLQQHQVAVINGTTTTPNNVPGQPACEEAELVTDHSVEWRLVAAILDRLFFIVYFLLLVVITIWMFVRILNH